MINFAHLQGAKMTNFAIVVVDGAKYLVFVEPRINAGEAIESDFVHSLPPRP